jgi:hypothetical protein
MCHEPRVSQPRVPRRHALGRPPQAPVLLTVGVLLFGLAGCVAPAQSLGTFACQDSAARPVELFGLGGPSVIFESGGVTTLPGAYVVAGIERDAAATGAGSAERPRTVEIVHEHEGRLPPPSRASERPAMDAPVPVYIGEHQWGLLWAEAVPRPWHTGSWPTDRFTELWFAERISDTWQTPIRIAEANMGLDWVRGRTVAQIAERGAFVMLTSEEHVTDRHVLFGSVTGELARMPLPAYQQPYAATFLGGEDDGITAVVQVGRAAGAPEQPLELLMLRSEDEGASWSQPESFWQMDAVISNLRLHRDGEGTPHVVWTEGFTETRHVRISPGTGAWMESSVQGVDRGGAAISGVSGIDRCGRITLARVVLDGSGEATLQLMHWTGEKWAAKEILDNYLGIGVFAGSGHDGTWYVTWSGRMRGETAANTNLSIWLFAP